VAQSEDPEFKPQNGKKKPQLAHCLTYKREGSKASRGNRFFSRP
jgi:hypothetical protein